MKKIPTLFERVFDTYIVSAWMIYFAPRPNNLYAAAWFPKEIRRLFLLKG